MDKIFIIILWLHHLTFSGAFSLTFGSTNGVNVISNDIKPTKIQYVHFNNPDAALKKTFLKPSPYFHWSLTQIVYIIVMSLLSQVNSQLLAVLCVFICLLVLHMHAHQKCRK